MGKSYIENSLKRFLKRKVKITLGLVVTFLITGMVSFAEEANPYKEGTIEYHKWEAEKALEGTFLNGKGTNSLSELNGKTDNDYTITITEENGNSKISVGNLAADISVPNQYISNNILNNLKNINSANSNTENNFGILKASGSLINNYGIIVGGQTLKNNYGLILGGQVISEEGYNHGIIIRNGSSAVQTINGGNGYNYGVLNATSTNRGQDIQKGIGYNYGLIKTTGAKGQVTNNSAESEAYNYGYIISQSQGQYINTKNGHEGGNTYNYGTILTTEGINIGNTTTSSTAYNYGVVINNNKKDDTIYSGKVNDRGIIIYKDISGKDLSLGTGEIKGVVLKAGSIDNETGKVTGITYDENNNTKVINLTNESNKDVNTALKNDTSKTTVYTQNTTAEITGNMINDLVGKTLTGVVDSSAGDNTTLYKFTGNGNALVLDDTVITGYFQKAGTLLDVTGKKLVIGGGTVINAVQEDFTTGATAVKLGKDGILTVIGTGQVIGKIDGGKNDNTLVENIALQDTKGVTDITAEILKLRNANEHEEILVDAGKNYTDVKYKEVNVKKMELDFTTGDDKANIVNILNASEIGEIDGSSSTEKIELTVDSTENIGNITLGQNDDKFTVTNSAHNGIIDMGTGNDEFNVSLGAVEAEHKKEAGNTFDYKVNGAEKIVLNGEGWHIGENAELNGGTTTKAGEKTELHIADKGSLHVDMNNNYGKGNVTTSLDKMASGADLSVTTGTDAEVKFVVGDKFNVSKKQFEVAHDYSVKDANLGAAVIFKGTGKDGAVEEKNGKIALTVKDATEYNGQLDDYKSVYDAMLGGLSGNEELRDAVNYSDESKLVGMITKAGNTAEAFYTTGYAVTKDVTDTYMSVVDDFGRKAGKGEWIAYGKYVNSDTEFDGGKASKGYDGDITGTVGMLEYGVNDTTSYGVVYGQGDTEVDIQGGGKLDGDNTYFGGYVKHRTQGGFDLTGNVGYTKSELDLNLATSAGVYNMITSGKSDADALTFALKGKKDYLVTDTVKLQPVFGARYTLINQDAVESSDANYRMDEQDVTIFEGMFGGNAVKEFDLYNGKLSLSVGAEYVLADVSKSDDARYTLYGKEIALTGEEDIADNRIEGHIGIDYEHESGVGVDTKYEMIWTDKGDNSRVTTGISYRF